MTHANVEKIQFTGSLDFALVNVERFGRKVKNKAPVVYPLEDFEYGMREFAIRDNNRCILQFGREIKPQSSQRTSAENAEKSRIASQGRNGVL